MNKLNTLYILCFLSLISCLSPDKMKTTDDDDLNNLISLIELQPSLVTNATLEKEIQISGRSEKKTSSIDTTFFDNDFKILGGKDLGLVFLSGGYDKKVSQQTIEYIRKPSEKAGPISLKISKSDDGGIHGFSLYEENKNVLYQSTLTSEFNFDKSKMLKAYTLDGFQKLTAGDVSNYRIIGLIK